MPSHVMLTIYFCRACIWWLAANQSAWWARCCSAAHQADWLAASHRIQAAETKN